MSLFVNKFLYAGLIYSAMLRNKETIASHERREQSKMLIPFFANIKLFKK